MKKYDRIKKEYVSEEELERRQRKRKTCKGGKEHDWVEVLPWGVEAGEGYHGSPEPYYEAKKAIYEFEMQKIRELAEIGIVVKHTPSSPREARLYICSVCKKKKYG